LLEKKTCRELRFHMAPALILLKDFRSMVRAVYREWGIGGDPVGGRRGLAGEIERQKTFP
jgi:hypothetical protein